MKNIIKIATRGRVREYVLQNIKQSFRWRVLIKCSFNLLFSLKKMENFDLLYGSKNKTAKEENLHLFNLNVCVIPPLHISYYCRPTC